MDHRLTRENQSLRKRLRDLEAQVKAREEAELSEQERMQRPRIALETQVQTTRGKARDVALHAGIANRAATLGIVGPVGREGGAHAIADASSAVI